MKLLLAFRSAGRRRERRFPGFAKYQVTGTSPTGAIDLIIYWYHRLCRRNLIRDRSGWIATRLVRAPARENSDRSDGEVLDRLPGVGVCGLIPKGNPFQGKVDQFPVEPPLLGVLRQDSVHFLERHA